LGTAYDEFFDLKQVAFAKHCSNQGNERVQQLRAGQRHGSKHRAGRSWLSLEARRVSAAVRPGNAAVLKRGEQMPRELLVMAGWPE